MNYETKLSTCLVGQTWRVWTPTWIVSQNGMTGSCSTGNYCLKILEMDTFFRELENRRTTQESRIGMH